MNLEMTAAPVGVHGERLNLDAGESIPLHIHPYEHTIDLLSGKARVVIGDVTDDFSAPATFVFQANVPHSYTAITAAVFDLWHSQSAMQLAIDTVGWVHKNVMKESEANRCGT